MRLSSTLLTAFIGIALLPGCGTESATETASVDGTTSQQAAVNAGEPSSQMPRVIEDGEQSETSQCVAIFLDSLRRGDERTLNGVLTAKARTELAKTDYAIQPIGAPEGKFRIGRVLFPYETSDVALVECVWTDPPTPDMQAIEMDIVCEVHLEADVWRISGLGLSIPGTEETLVLDFEDSASLQATIDAAIGDTSGQPSSDPGSLTSPQRIAGGEPMQTPAGMPELPSYPSPVPSSPAPTTPSAPPATQIALPPTYDAPINR